MKKVLVVVLLLTIVSTLPSAKALACTGYAVYSDTVYYGMNFDYPDVPISFNISYDNSGIKFFHMDFKEEDTYIMTVGMNDKGRFASCQMLYNGGNLVSTIKENEIGVGDVFLGSLCSNPSFDEIIDYLSDHRLVDLYRNLHTLIADPSGKAMVLEAGKENNLISDIGDKQFIVMTNFLNSSIKDDDKKDVSGVGSDRYLTAYNYIQENIDSFDYDKAFNVLESTVQTSTYPTQSSMVFLPEKLEIYIALNRNFNKIWKVDIEKGTIESFAGFDKDYCYNIDNGSIMMGNLTNPSDDEKNIASKAASASDKDTKADQKTVIYIASIVTMMIAAIAFYFIIYHCKKDKHK